MRSALILLFALCLLPFAFAPCSASAQSIEGRWKLLAAEDIRADGSVARYPWGRSPVGSIVVAGGGCYVQIMSGDTPYLRRRHRIDRRAHEGGAPLHVHRLFGTVHRR